MAAREVGRSAPRLRARWAQTIACHSGEKTAYGQNAATFGCSGAYASRATGGTIASAVAQRSSGSASAGPSISTASGWYASSAATSDRADPGPWCRMPNTWTGAPAEPAASGP